MSETPTPILDTIGTEERRVFARHLQNYLGEFVRSADQKAALVFAASVSLLGFTLGRVTGEKSFPLWLIVVVVVLPFVSVVLAASAIWPRQDKIEGGLLAWQVASRTGFATELQAAPLGTLTDEVLKYDTELARILLKKYPRIRHAIWTSILGAVVVGLALTCQSRRNTPRPEAGKEMTLSHMPTQPEFSGDQTVYLEAHNMDQASKLDMEPFVLHEANLYFSHNNDCAGVFVTKNRNTAAYELRFDYLSAHGKMTMIGRLSILWDKSEMVVGTWSGNDIKQVVDSGGSTTCSRIALMKLGPPSATQNPKTP